MDTLGPVHETRIRVRFDEVDTMRVVHHPRYLVWFEVARTEYFRALGVSYRSVMESGTHLAVVDAGARYLRPARYDDEVTVETRCAEAGGATVLLRYVVRRGGDVLATGHTLLGAIHPDGRAKRMPADLRERFEAAARTPPPEPGAPHGAGEPRVQGET